METDRQNPMKSIGMWMPLFPACVINLVLPHFESTYRLIGTTLPSLTSAMLACRHALWLTPLLVYAIRAWARRGKYRAFADEVALLAGIALTVCMIIVGIFALYLPLLGVYSAIAE